VEVDRAHKIAEHSYEVFFEVRFKTWLEAEDSHTLEDQVFEVDIPENKDCKYQVNSVSMVGFEVAAATGGGLELRLVADDEPTSTTGCQTAAPTSPEEGLWTGLRH
jgi:hypothetical protein